MSPDHTSTRARTIAGRASGRRRRIGRRGLSLVEVMISLAIAAMLLTAVGAAFSASASAIDVNDEFSRATQAGRVTLHHLQTEIRRGYVDENPWSPEEIHVITDTGQLRTYRYVPADGTTPGRIMLITADDATDRDYVLCSNVNEPPFQVELGKNWQGHDCVAQVAIVINVRVGDNTVRLSGSAAPRRNLTY